ADRELRVRLGQRELVEEDLVDLPVIVLSGVDELLLDAAPPFQLGIERRDLHVVRARADDVRDEGLPGHAPILGSAIPGGDPRSASWRRTTHLARGLSRLPILAAP